jgi:hypothetical protein
MNMIMEIIIGAKNPSVFSIKKSYDLKIIKKSKVEKRSFEIPLRRGQKRNGRR